VVPSSFLVPLEETLLEDVLSSAFGRALARASLPL